MRIKKTSENRALAGRVVNIKNSSTTDSYSSDYINTKLSNITPKVVNSFYYYIDGVNGNDNNDGLTSATAFKSIGKFFSKLDEGATDLRGHIISAGDYVLNNVNAISNVSIHLNTNGLNIKPKIIFGTSNKSIVFYQSHVNLANIELSQAEPTEYRIYFEGCTVGMNNVTINDNTRLGLLECGIEVIDLTCRRLELSKTSGYINGLTITNTDIDTCSIEIEYCSGLRLLGNLIVASLSGTATSEDSVLIRTRYSELNIMLTVVDAINNKYKYGLHLVNTVVFITKNRYTYLYTYYGLQDHKLENANIIQQTLMDTDWIDITPTSGTAHTNVRYKPQYRIKNGILYLHGIITNAGTPPITEGSTLFTLPTTSVPLTKRMTIPTAAENVADYNYVRVYETGEVKLFKTTMTAPEVYLDGIEIPLDF